MIPFKNRSQGYFINMIASLVALILAVFVVATQSTAMPNGADGMPIAMVLLAGVLVQIVFTVLPCRFSGIVLAGVYTASVGVTINSIINVFADVSNHVSYAGGNFVICMIYLVTSLLIAVACVVASFFEQYQSGEIMRKGK